MFVCSCALFLFTILLRCQHPGNERSKIAQATVTFTWGKVTGLRPITGSMIRILVLHWPWVLSLTPVLHLCRDTFIKLHTFLGELNKPLLDLYVFPWQRTSRTAMGSSSGHGVRGAGSVHDFRREAAGVCYVLRWGSDNGGHWVCLVSVSVLPQGKERGCSYCSLCNVLLSRHNIRS